MNKFWSNHMLNLWYLWYLCVRVYSLTRSRPCPLSLFLWWLMIIAITHWNWNKLRLRWWRSRMQSLTRCISGAHPLSITRRCPGEPGGPGGPGSPQGPRGTSGSSKEVKFSGDGSLVSSPPSFSGVIIWG